LQLISRSAVSTPAEDKGDIMTCANCQSAINLEDRTYFKIYQAALDADSLICSPSCLVEMAWRIRESQPKLSKSKRETGGPTT
jgi:hypothetical protein